MPEAGTITDVLGPDKIPKHRQDFTLKPVFDTCTRLA
jgi:hypothetical protein